MHLLLASCRPALRAPRPAAAPRLARLVAFAAHPQLSKAERNEKRAEAQRLGKKLVVVHLGQKGMTPAFLQGLSDALAANQLVKVRVGGTPDGGLAELAATLEAEADCLCVHRVGGTVTLYRDASLGQKRSRPASSAGGSAAAAAARQPAGHSSGGGGGGGAEAASGTGTAAVVGAEAEQEEEVDASFGGGPGKEEGAEEEGAEDEEAGEDEDEAAALSEFYELEVGGRRHRHRKPPEYTVLA